MQSPLEMGSTASIGSMPSRRASTAVMSGSPLGSVQGASPTSQMGSPLSRQGSKLKRKLSRRRLGAQQSSAVARHNLFLKAGCSTVAIGSHACSCAFLRSMYSNLKAKALKHKLA